MGTAAHGMDLRAANASFRRTLRAGNKSAHHRGVHRRGAILRRLPRGQRSPP
jgi:hypothetical protein